MLYCMSIPQAGSKISRHAAEKKLVEAASVGTDPYVVAYLGRVRDKRTQTVRTESVVADPMNDNGTNPVWSSAHCQTEAGLPTDNVLHVGPGAEDIHLTLELWDSDIDADDFLGGRTLKLDDLRQELIVGGGSATMHIQLFEQDGYEGFERGHDAGVLQILASFETDTPKGSEIEMACQIIRIEVQAAVDLLPDTPAIRDLTTFSDNKNALRLLLVMALYLPTSALYMAWMFDTYACGEVRCGQAAPNSTEVVSYPGDGGPLVDGLLFMLSSIMTIGWGNQPVNLASSPDDPTDRMVFGATRVFLTVNLFVGVLLMAMLVGTLGTSMRAIFRRNSEVLYGALALTPMVDKPGEIPTDGLCGSLGASHVAIIMVFSVVLFGTLVFSWTEDLRFADALYLAIVGFALSGGGDVAPTTAASKWFAVLYMPMAVSFLANAFATIQRGIEQARKDEVDRFVLGQYGQYSGETNKEIGCFDFEELQRTTSVEYGAPLSLNDFRLAMLMRLGRVEENDIELIDQVFMDIDYDGSGFWTQDRVCGESECTMTRRMFRLQSRWAEARESDGLDSSV
eukprot:COSAG02_NODE_7597_length_2942_cov_8.737953_2_plen_567_part_00